MFLWERRSDQRDAQVAQAAPDGLFTPQQEERLRSLRAHAQALMASEEHGLDRKRLTFARWLVEHGKVGEEV